MKNSETFSNEHGFRKKQRTTTTIASVAASSSEKDTGSLKKMKGKVLISVSDKTGVVELAQGLVKLGYEIVSTGGSFRTLKEAGVAVSQVESITNFPEMLDGRVKTLHPAVHGGILARRDLDQHMAAMNEQSFGLIDVVVCNLYPFRSTVTNEEAKPSFQDAIENIDIGGPTLSEQIREYPQMTPVYSYREYPPYIPTGGITPNIPKYLY